MEPGGFFGSMTQAPLPSRGSPSHARPTSLWGGATAEDQFQKSQGHQKRVPHKTSLDGGDTATMAAEADGEEYKRKAPMTSVWGGDAGAKVYSADLEKVHFSQTERQTHVDGSTCPWDSTFGGSRAARQPVGAAPQSADASANTLWFAQHRKPPPAAAAAGGDVPRGREKTSLW